jgi:hypothetical protein
MRFPSRITVAALVTVATLIVCFLGVRAELKSAENSIAAHRLRAQPAQQAARLDTATRDEQRPVAPKDAATP